MKLENILALIFIFFLGTYSFAQDKNNLEKLELKGKVKSINTISYGVEIKSDRIKKDGRSRPAGAEEDRTIFFNESGMIIEEQEFDLRGELFNTVIYEYDNIGNVVSRTNTYTSGIQKVRLDSNVYDQNDLLLEKYCSFKYKENGTPDFELSEKYKYDLSGNIIEMLFIGDPAKFEKYSYKYDTDGNKTEMNVFVLNDSVGMKIIFTSDLNGKISETNQFGSNGKLLLTNNFFYDALGNLTLAKTSTNDYLIRTIEYIYEYDENDNWIKKIEYWQGEPLYLLERKIIYYK